MAQRERYYMQSTAIFRAKYLMESGHCVTYYPDMYKGDRCWIIEFK